jgi:hypothetical protein
MLIKKNCPKKTIAQYLGEISPNLVTLDNQAEYFGLNSNIYITVRVARWFIFKPKIPIWVNFGVP